MRIFNLALILFLTTSTLFASNANSNFIEAVKNTKAATLENDLPNMMFKDWVIKTFKKGNEAKWIINDCGEGSSAQNPRSPTCVEVQIPQQNNYYLHISSLIGVTTEQEITTPNLWMVYFYKGQGYKTIDVIVLKTIKEAVLLYQTNLGEK